MEKKTIIEPLIYFDVINKNDRIYIAEEVMPKVKELRKKIKEQGILYGQLGHPSNTRTMFNKVSHVINRIFKKKNVLYGELTLLNTTNGKILTKNLSKYVFRSRAAGIVDENKIVRIKELYSFDAVLKSKDSFIEQSSK